MATDIDDGFGGGPPLLEYVEEAHRTPPIATPPETSQPGQIITTSPREKVLADILKVEAYIKAVKNHEKMHKIQEKEKLKKLLDAEDATRKYQNSTQGKIDQATRDFRAYVGEVYSFFHLHHSNYSIEERDELVNIFYEKLKWRFWIYCFGMSDRQFLLMKSIRLLKRHGVTNYFDRGYTK